MTVDRAPGRHRRGAMLVLLGLCGCGTTARESSAPRGRVEGSGTAILASEAGITLLGRRADGREIPTAELRGVRFDGGAGPVELPFRSWERRGEVVALEVASPSDHDLAVTVRYETDGSLRVELTDRVVAWTRIVELGLTWHSLADGPIDELEVPLPHERPDQVAGDDAFRAPIAYLRQAEVALAVIPDLIALARERVLPQALEIERGSRPSLRHSLVAQVSDAGGTRRRRDLDRSATLRRETIHLTHRVISDPAAVPQRTRAALRARQWELLARPRLAGATDPLLRAGFDELAARHLDDAASRILRRHAPAGEALLFVVDPDRSSDGQETMSFGARSNALHLALAFARAGRRTGRADWSEAAHRITAFALTAPNRSGLVPTALRRSTTHDVDRWSPGDPSGPRPEVFASLDAATTGLLLLELAPLQPQHAAAIRSLGADLARFFRDNQAADGSIPAYYEPEFLRPLPSSGHEPVAATAGPALFLTRWSAWSGDATLRQAARLALRHLTSAALPERAFADPSAGALAELRSGSRRVDLVPLALATSAAVELAALDPALRGAALALLDELATLQQIWDPPWLPWHAFGSFGSSDADCGWNDGATPLAARALIDGYLAFGRRIDLERGVAALRAAMVEPAPFDPGREFRPDPALFAAAATSASEYGRRVLGQAVVDPTGGFALGVDALFAELTQQTELELTLRIGTFAPLAGPIALRVHHPNATPQQLLVNNSPVVDPAAAFAHGVVVEPIRLPILAFAPPPTIPATGWRPIARFDGPAPASGTCRVEIADGRRIVAELPLTATAQGLLVVEDHGAPVLPLGAEFTARLHWTWNGFEQLVPRDGARPVRVSDALTIDPGDDLELALASSSEGARLVRFLDGREFAREAAPGETFSYEIATPRDAAAVELRIRAAGALRISGSAAGETLVDESGVPPGARDLELRLADRRLWETGILLLRFEPATDQPIQVARIELRPLGQTTITAGAGTARTPIEPPPTLEILVVPIVGPGESERPSEPLRLAVFGGAEYRVTPEPESRSTLGSVARFVEQLSGGRTALTGAVLDAVRTDVPHDELASDANGARARFVASIREPIAATVRQRGRAPRLILAVYDGGPLPMDGASVGVVAGADVVLCSERSSDGSIVACGRLGQLILGRCFGFSDLSGPDDGAFGELALTGGTEDHVPPAPAGPNLLRTGWVSAIDLEPSADVPVRIAPAVAGRTILRLWPPPGFGRPTLTLEARTARSREGVAGLLAYWESQPGSEPLLVRLDGRTARPRWWRLANGRPSTSTPFETGAESDLFVRVPRLDARSLPPLITPEGESPWVLSDVHVVGGEAINFRVRATGIDVLDAPIAWWTRSAGGLGPLPADGVDRGLGSAVITDGALRVGLVDRAGARIVGSITVPRGALPWRIFGRLAPALGGHVRFRLLAGDRTLLDATHGVQAQAFTVDLPGAIADERSLVLEFTRIDGAPNVDLQSLVALPRSGAAGGLPLSALPSVTAKATDGVLHGGARALELDERGQAELRVPVVLPAANGLLRLRILRPAGATDRMRIDVSLRELEPRARTLLLDDHELEPQHSGTLLIELPSGDESRVGFLELRAQGPANATLLIVDAAVLRG